MVAESLDRKSWQITAQYVVDEEGKRVSVLVPVDQWEKLLDDLEDLWDTRALDDALAEGGEPVAWEDLKAELDRARECDTA
ncbi:MAG: hypothetical protein ACKVT1_03180 [Dehalococcoidia bacterium]